MNQHMSREEKMRVPESETVHTLSLRPLPFSGSCFVEFEADFSPRKSSESSSVSTLPSFNSDGKHFTPAFFLTSELNEEQHWEQYFFRNFENKKNQYTLQNKHMYQPKPESRYCQVCHQYFQDYQYHTKHSVHVKKLRQGTIQVQINRLIQNFKTSDKSFKRNSPTNDDLLIRKSENPNSDCFEEGQKKVRKIVKTQNLDKERSEVYSTVGSLKKLIIEQKEEKLSEF